MPGLLREVLEDEVEEPDDLLSRLDAVTAEGVQRVTGDLLDGRRTYLALVGPHDEPERFEKLFAG